MGMNANVPLRGLRPGVHVVALLLATVCVPKPSASAASDDKRASAPGDHGTAANVMAEITFEAEKPHADRSGDLTLDVEFTGPNAAVRKVPAFWAGGNTWKVRYASGTVGRHAFVSTCSDPSDRGLHGVRGTVTVVPYEGDNPLYKHGPLRVAEDRRHFVHADGTPFFWLGDTWWMGLCRRLHWPEDFRRLAADRKAKGFNVIQIVAGLYPDMPAFDPRGANEAGFPWERDYSRIRPAYFNRADERLFYLVDRGFVPCIVGAWGYHLPWMGTDRMKRHWRHLIARYGALPVVWCAAGEGTMPFYNSQNREEEARLQKQGWTEVIRFIHATDPFDRIVTIHPSGSARDTVTDPGVLDFDMHQTGHRPESGVGRVARRIRAAYGAEPTMPVIAGESSYDGLDLSEWGGDVLTSDAARQMFWVCVMDSGVAGGTYGANGIWQVNRRDQPYGPSPHGRSWGSTPWDEAMKRPGSTQVGLAKRFFESFPWHRFRPLPDSVAWAEGAPKGDSAIEPCAAGISGELLVVYAPRPWPVVVTGLDPNADYAAGLFNPVTGERTSLGPIRPDKDGAWSVSPPDGDHDWVLVLEKRRTARN
jgi:hypothetical protein